MARIQDRQFAFPQRLESLKYQKQPMCESIGLTSQSIGYQTVKRYHAIRHVDIRLLGKSTLQILPIVITIVSVYVLTCAFGCVHTFA